MPGIIEVEPVRIVPAVLRNGRKTYRGAINGLVTTPRLNHAVDKDLATIHMRQEGVILASALADILDITPGESLTVDVREGGKPGLANRLSGIAGPWLASPP